MTHAYAMSHLSAVYLACTRAGWMPTDPQHAQCRASHGYISLQQQQLLVMAALRSRCGHYIFVLFLLSFPRL